MSLDDVRPFLSGVAAAALDEAARRCAAGRPIDTRGVLVAMMALDHFTEWDRIWLEFASLDAVATAVVIDSAPDPGDQWLSLPVTSTCATAVRAALILADVYGALPVPLGFLGLCMVGLPSTGAARALIGDSPERHTSLIELAQEVLIGGGLEDIEAILPECFSRAATAVRPDGLGVDRFDDLEAIWEEQFDQTPPAGPWASGNLSPRQTRALGPVLEELFDLHEVADGPRSIPLCEQALALMKRKDHPYLWATISCMLANGLAQHPSSDLARDIERAMGLYRRALKVFTKADTPEPWAMTMMNLGAAYGSWVKGFWADNVESAIEHFQLARGIGEGNVTPGLWAGIHNNLGAGFLERVRGERAKNIEISIRYFTIALAAYGGEGAPPSEVDLWPEWARAQDNLGRAFFCRRTRRDSRHPDGNTEDAIRCFRRALQVRTPDVFPCEFAVTMKNLGDAVSDRTGGERVANIDEGISCYESALSALSECPHEDWPRDWAMLVYTLGLAYAEQLLPDPATNVRRAIAFFERARQTFVAAPGVPSGGQSHSGLQQAQILLGLGQVYANPALRGQPEYPNNLEQAVVSLKAALSLLDREATPDQWVTAKDSLGAVYADRIHGRRTANLQQAIIYFEEALTVSTFPMDRARTLHNRATAKADLAVITNDAIGDREQGLASAIDDFAEAVEIYRKAGILTRLRTTAWELGKACADAGRWDQAARAFLEAVSVTDTLYDASLLQDAKEAELSDASGLYQQAGYALARANRLTEAVEFLERGRSRALSEALARDSAVLAAVPGDMAVAYRKAATELHRLETLQWKSAQALAQRPIQSALGMNSRGQSIRRITSDLREEIQKATEELNAVIAQIQMAVNKDFLARSSFVTVAAALTADNPVAYLSLTLYGGVALLVHSTPANPLSRSDHEAATVRSIFMGRGQEFSQILWDLLVTTDDDDEVVGGYLPGQRQESMDWVCESINALLPILGQRMIGPLAELLTNLGATGVTLLLGPPLGLLPLHAAIYQKNGQTQRFLDDFVVSYAPTARVLNVARAAVATRQSRVPRLVGVADPHVADLQPLPFTHAELYEAALHFESHKALHGEQATRQALIEGAHDATHIHLACHGEFNVAEPRRSRLLLAAGTELTLNDIMAEQPFRDARLVVLSACETAVTDIRRLPDEAIGLPAGILQAGVPGVIATLWPVSDLAGTLVMTRFYEYHMPDSSSNDYPLAPAAALRQAQQWLSRAACHEVLSYCDAHEMLSRKLQNTELETWLTGESPEVLPFGHPIFWAPFVFIGA